MAEAEEIDGASLEDFMETVTTYKCKFCAFMTTTTQNMANHVRSQHIVKKAPAVAISDQFLGKEQNQTPVSLQGPFEKSTPFLPSSVSETSQTSVYSSVLADHNAVTSVSMVTSDHISHDVSQNQNMLVSLSKTEPGGVQVATYQPKDLVSMETDNGNLGEFQFISEGDNGKIILQNSENVQIGANGMVHVLVQDTDSHTGQGQVGSRKVLDAGTTGATCEKAYLIKNNSLVPDFTDPDTSQTLFVEDKELLLSQSEPDVYTDIDKSGETEGMDDTVTKELYLCGTCSEGFASIQECKNHMMECHDVVEFQSTTPAMVTGATAAPPVSNTSSNKVDCATQVEPRKRVGRKKKSEIAAIEAAKKLENEEKEAQGEDEDNEEGDGIKVEVLSDSDEDWVANLHQYSTRSRRKRRPPQALKKDYYLGRKKKKETKQKEWVGWGFRCDVKGCGTKFDTEEVLKKHMEFHVDGPNPDIPMFKCTDCSEVFNQWKATRLHIWKSHNIDVGMFKCSECNFRTDGRSKLKVHVETHGTDRPYKCQQCNKGFKQFAQLKNHEYSHQAKLPITSPEYASSWHTPKTCNICGRTFVNLKCLRKHQETVHSTVKPFKCTYCDHTCSRKAMLILHLRTHTGEKPFKCPQCQYSCSDHNSLRRHKMRHTGLKPYKCPHCPYACIQAISLKVHVKNKHPGLGGIFCCNICLYRTVNEAQYKNHLLDHEHGLIIEVENAGDGQSIVKPIVRGGKTQHSQAPVPRQVILTDLSGQSNVMQVIQEPLAGFHQMVQIPVASSNRQEQVAQLQIQLNEQTENVINVEEYADITTFDTTSQSQSDVATANLIYSAISAISLQSSDQSGETVNPQDLIARVENGDIQTSIETNSTKDGVKTHYITFHLPNGGEMLGGVTLQEGPEDKIAESGLQVGNL